MKFLHMLSCILIAIGGLNWGLIGITGKGVFDYVSVGMTVAKVVYILVGLATIYLIFEHKKTCRHCNPGNTPAAM